MTLPTAPIREEHGELLPRVEGIREVADAIDDMPLSELKSAVERTLAFLQGELIVHAAAEDAELYPVVAGLMGSELATKTMSRDHEEVVRLTAQLGDVQAAMYATITSPGQVKAVRRDLARVLYSLYAIIAVHFAKEEEVYLPLLDNSLSPAAAKTLFDRMERAARQTRARAA